MTDEVQQARDRIANAEAFCKCGYTDVCGYHRSAQFAQDTILVRKHQRSNAA